jgi:hypothetical protein
VPEAVAAPVRPTPELAEPVKPVAKPVAKPIAKSVPTPVAKPPAQPVTVIAKHPAPPRPRPRPVAKPKPEDKPAWNADSPFMPVRAEKH